jgi:hypothetical protein
VPQWIIELEAPVDVSALLRGPEDDDAAIVQGEFASQVLEGGKPTVAGSGVADRVADSEPMSAGEGGEPTLDKVIARAGAIGVSAEIYLAYTDRRWGSGWKLNRQGRRRAWDELERYRNDPQGYVDKVESELKVAS